jgi:hypothetical protein
MAIVAALVISAGGAKAQGRDRSSSTRTISMSHSVNRATFEALERDGSRRRASSSPAVVSEVAVGEEAPGGPRSAVNSEWTGFRWGPLSRGAVPSLVDAQGYMALEEQEVARRAKMDEVERELRAQIDFARAAGVGITHLDSHMATMSRTAELLAVYRRLGESYRLPQLLEKLAPPGGTRSPWEAAAASGALVDRVISINPASRQDGSAPTRAARAAPPGTYERSSISDSTMRRCAERRGTINWGAAWRRSDFDLVKSQAFRDFLKAQRPPSSPGANWANETPVWPAGDARSAQTSPTLGDAFRADWGCYGVWRIVSTWLGFTPA